MGGILFFNLIAGALILPELDNSTVSNIWVAATFIFVIFIFTQVRKVDKIAAKDKKVKRDVSKTFVSPMKYYIIGTILIILIYVITILIEKAYSMHLIVLRIVLWGLVIIGVSWTLWKKRIGRFSKR